MESLKQHGKGLGTRGQTTIFKLQLIMALYWETPHCNSQHIGTGQDWTLVGTDARLYSVPSKINQLKASTASWCADI